jgi:hypothetical protein
MFPTAVVALLAMFFLAGIAVYLWPRPRLRFERIFVATFGALVGSLIGRLTADPGWMGHLLFVAMGAFALSVVDRFRSSSTRS